MEEQHIIIKVPARLHLSVWDMCDFGLGIQGGGGVGIALSEYTIIEGYLDSQEVITGESFNLAKIFLAKLKKQFRIEKKQFNIRISRKYPMHTGMGSTGSLLLGMIKLIIKLLDISYSADDIVSIYMGIINEEHNGKITDCFETSVGPWACLKGGMVVVDKKCNFVKKFTVCHNLHVMLVLPVKKNIISSINDEIILLEGEGKRFDRQDREIKEAIMNKISKLDNEKKEYCLKREICANIDLLKYIGSKKAEIMFQEKKHNGVYNQMIKIAEKNNILLSGMSSVGPLFFYIDKKDKLDVIKKELNTPDYKIVFTSVENNAMM